MSVPIRIRRGSSQQWADKNPILLDGELAYNTTTAKFKIGNCLSRWSDLPYLSNAAYVLTFAVQSGSSGVTNVVLEQDGVSLDGEKPCVPIPHDCTLVSWAASWQSSNTPAGDWTAVVRKKNIDGTLETVGTFSLRTS